MARVELPESRLRLRKRRRRTRIALLLLVAAVLAGGGLAAAAHIPAIQVRTVAISGNQALSSTTIEAFVRERLAGTRWYVLPKSNIFLYPKALIRADLLAAYPVLASVDVHAQDFHTVAVSVVERHPRALWCPQQGTCLFLDENGAAYEEAPVFSEPVYTVYTGPLADGPLPRHFLSAEEFQTLSALVDALVQKLPGKQLSRAAVGAENDAQLQFTDGFVLKFAMRDAAGDVFDRLTVALTAEPLLEHPLSDFEYLDLRFGDKLYYKLK